jgi:hypothetical protein
VEFRAGIGSPGAALWSKTFYVVGNGLGQYWGTGGDLAFPSSNMVLDLSEGAPYLDSMASNNVFFGCIDKLSDGVSGSIAYLAAEYLPWDASALSTETPKAIPGYNTYAYCNVAISKPSGVANTGMTGVSRNQEISVYPNPAQDRCAITYNAAASAAAEVAIYDVTGRLVKSMLAQRGRCSWNLRNDRDQRIAPGVYFIRATAEGSEQTLRLIVLR